MEMRHRMAILQRLAEFSGPGRERKKEKLIKNDRNTICTIPVPQFKLQLRNGKSLFLTKVQSQDPVTYYKYNTVYEYYCIAIISVPVLSSNSYDADIGSLSSIRTL